MKQKPKISEEMMWIYFREYFKEYFHFKKITNKKIINHVKNQKTLGYFERKIKNYILFPKHIEPLANKKNFTEFLSKPMPTMSGFIMLCSLGRSTMRDWCDISRTNDNFKGHCLIFKTAKMLVEEWCLTALPVSKNQRGIEFALMNITKGKYSNKVTQEVNFIAPEAKNTLALAEKFMKDTFILDVDENENEPLKIEKKKELKKENKNEK